MSDNNERVVAIFLTKNLSKLDVADSFVAIRTDHGAWHLILPCYFAMIFRYDFKPKSSPCSHDANAHPLVFVADAEITKS